MAGTFTSGPSPQRVLRLARQGDSLRCKKLLFAFREALPILVLALIVSVSHCASITASRSSAALRVNLLICELSLRRQIDFSSRHGATPSRFPVRLWNKFHVLVDLAAAQRFASAFCLH